MAAEKVAVEKDIGLAVNAIELQHQPAAAVFFRQGKSPPIPSHAVGWIVGAERLETVIGIGVGIEGQFRQPIMRQVNHAPGGVGERPPGRSRVDAGFVQALAQAPVVVQVKFPAKVQQQTLAGR